MSGIMAKLNDLYVNFMVWLGAEPPPGYEHLIGKEAGPRSYTLKKGDTLFSVARKFSLPHERLAKANGIEDPAKLKPGQTLLIPPASWDPASGPLARLQPPPSPQEEPVAAPPKPKPVVEAAPVKEVVAPAKEMVAPPKEAAVPEVVEAEVVAPPPEVIPAAVEAVAEEAPFEAEAAELPEMVPPVVEAVVEEAPFEAEAAALPEMVPPVVEAVAEEAPVVAEAAPPVEEELVFRYVVQRGDTLSSIARHYGVTVMQLVEANNLTEDRIFPGQKLIIPGYTPALPQPEPEVEPVEVQPAPPAVPPSDQYLVHTVTRGDTLNGIAKRYGLTVRDLVEANQQIDHPDLLRLGQHLLIPRLAAPAQARVEPAVSARPIPPAFVAVDPAFSPHGPADAVRALYVSYFAIGHPETRQRVFDLLETTELNAVVIDAKGDDGLISYPTQIPLAQEIGAARPTAKDLAEVMTQLKARGIYTIARVVVFKDGLLAKSYPQYAVKLNSSLEVLPGQESLDWTDPFLKPVWDYNIQVAAEAARLGFDEILLSHVRFPSPSQAGQLQFSQEATKETRVAATAGFLSLARGQLKGFGVRLAADVLGYTCWRKDDSLIGQDIERLGAYLDVLCPTLYPSAFGSGVPGYKMAVAYPYEVVQLSAHQALSRLAQSGCTVRPWLQDFPDYRFDRRIYGREEIQAQIKGSFEAGCAGFMVWNPHVKYTEGAYAPVRMAV